MKLHNALVLSSLFSFTAGEYFNEILVREDAVHNSAFQSPLPHTYIGLEELPESFNWGSVDGKSYLTKSLNQHIPQYCGSCWAHGALSSLGDRIKIARKAQGDDINLSIQFILNCGTEMAGSCHGGYVSTGIVARWLLVESRNTRRVFLCVFVVVLLLVPSFLFSASASTDSRPRLFVPCLFLFDSRDTTAHQHL